MITANDVMVELQAMGYLFWIEGDSIAYALTGSTDRTEGLPKDRIRNLFQTLKESKDVTMRLIELADQRRSIDERRHYLEVVMGLIWDDTLRSVLLEQSFRPSPETHVQEAILEQLWKDTLRGTASPDALVAFRKVVHEWKKAGQRAHEASAGPSREPEVWGYSNPDLSFQLR